MEHSTSTPAVTPVEDAARDNATQVAYGLRQLAAFTEANPDLADQLRFAFGRVLISNGGGVRGPGREFLARYARAGARFGAEVVKDFDSETWAAVDLFFGPVSLHVFANRTEVCERVVVGTREVTKQVPDPDALASVPTVTVTETVEDVEWRCTSLLAEGGDR